MNQVFILNLTGLVLYKRVSLPFKISSSSQISMIKKAISNKVPVAIISSKNNSSLEGELCVAGVPHILHENTDGSLDVFITGDTKFKLKKSITSSLPFPIYEANEVDEDLRVDESLEFDLINLRKILIHWAKDYIEEEEQRDSFYQMTKEPEMIVNYISVFLIDSMEYKNKIMKSKNIKEKIDLIINYLGPNEIRISSFLPSFEFKRL